MNSTKYRADNGAMLNAYPDSIGGNLSQLTQLLQLSDMQGAFTSLYILPSLFNTDLDRGFSVIDYGINKMLANKEDLQNIRALKIDLKLDFILNHASVLSAQFQDILKNGQASEYSSFFINWNEFWYGCGKMCEDGYIIPDKKYTENMFFRKPGLPILMVRMPNGEEIPYWNTFYQEVKYDAPDEQDIMRAVNVQYSVACALAEIVKAAFARSEAPKSIDFGSLTEYRPQMLNFLETRRKYLGQMDININSPLVWQHYDSTLKALSEYGAQIVRLDAFAYAPKQPGEKNFLNEPGTWDLLKRVRMLANKYSVELLPEIHASYEEKIYERLALEGYMTYDFFLPGLIIDALESKDAQALARWARELDEKKIKTVNMLGCHDGIPLLDLKGLIPNEQIEKLIALVVKRGGYVKNLHGQKNVYYQVNATYYSALGETDRAMLTARAIQLFMPGKPQIWYLDLFAGKNDHDAVARAGAAGHKEINRTNILYEAAKEMLQSEIVKKQLELLRWRSSFPAFGFDSKMKLTQACPEELCIQWSRKKHTACLNVNLATQAFTVSGMGTNGEIIFFAEQK